MFLSFVFSFGRVFLSFMISFCLLQLFSPGKDEIRKYFGTKMSANCSPQISYSRSSSRSFQDDFDYPDFGCPFDVDDDDMMDPGSR